VLSVTEGLPEAQAAAQVDYEQRIRSALASPSPSPVGYTSQATLTLLREGIALGSTILAKPLGDASIPLYAASPSPAPSSPSPDLIERFSGAQIMLCLETGVAPIPQADGYWIRYDDYAAALSRLQAELDEAKQKLSDFLTDVGARGFVQRSVAEADLAAAALSAKPAKPV
jgi:hypothetical protein